MATSQLVFADILKTWGERDWNASTHVHKHSKHLRHLRMALVLRCSCIQVQMSLLEAVGARFCCAEQKVYFPAEPTGGHWNIV